MPAPFGRGDPGGVRHRSEDWRLHVQLIKVGAGYSAGLPPLSPTWRLGDGSFGRDPFFNETAPKGKWVWWTMTQHPGAGGEQLEYIYVDAVTGEATSSCGEPQIDRLVRVPCPAPGTQPVPPARTRRAR